MMFILLTDKWLYLGIEIPLDILQLTILDCDQICTHFLDTCE